MNAPAQTPKPPAAADLPWTWRLFAGRCMLVTDGGGCQVVITSAHHTGLQTRDPETGILRGIDPTDPVAKIMANAPDLLRASQDLIHGIRLGLVKIESTERGKDFELTKVMQRLIEAMEASGT